MNSPTQTQDWNALTDEEFGRRAADFFDAYVPRHLCHLNRRPRWVEVKDWYLTMSAHGWLVPGWPVEYGGMGLSPSKFLVYVEELERCGAPRVMDQGLMNLGPVLIARGSEAQRRKFLPKILSGEHLWCQGYSEPNAGSDLASLRTEARLEGDEFVINGQKIWTSVAFDANHMFALVRTDKTVKKQAGISFLMIDMDQAGVTVRPIRNIAGHDELCEVFLDNVRTPRDYLVGELWKIPGVEIAKPSGAMYVFFRVGGAGDSLDYCKKLVTAAHIGLAPGIAFGPEGEGFLRWCFAANEENLAEGVRRFLKFRG